MTLLDFIVLALASARIANLLADTEQSGPWGLLNKLRYRMGVRFDEYSMPYGTNMLAALSLCVYCSGIWIGALATIAWFVAPQIAFWLSMPFAIGSVIIHVGRVD